MHNNYYFLKNLTPALSKKLKEAQLAECFSQNKNELILSFITASGDFHIKAHLDPTFCCLYFTEEFHRARRNSVDLFEKLADKKVTDLMQFKNERCFSIQFEGHLSLLFKMHGNRSNLILFDNNEPVELFNNRLKNDWELDLNKLDRPIDQSKESFIKADGDINALFPTFGKVVKGHLKQKGFHTADSLDDKWQIVSETLAHLENPTYSIAENRQIYLTLLPEDTIIEEFDNPISAINNFFILYVSTATFRKLKNQTLQEIEKVIKQSENYLDKASGKLKSLSTESNYQQTADIIMANLHNIEAGVSEVQLPNFYNDQQVTTIKLKKNLSPQKNAEVYYRKAKNQQKEVDNLKASIKSKEQRLVKYYEHKENIEHQTELKALREYIKNNNLEAEKTQAEKTSKPYHEFEVSGFKIWVGKNAKSNDKLLQAHSFKNDLWLHAKDVSGSHVLIKQQAGKNFPKNVVEAAAQLAAYYSKRKTDSLCPVIVTPRKYVRKRKGDPPGAVVVDKEEEVLLVEPQNLFD